MSRILSHGWLSVVYCKLLRNKAICTMVSVELGISKTSIESNYLKASRLSRNFSLKIITIIFNMELRGIVIRNRNIDN